MVQAQAPAHVPAQPGVVIIPAKKDTIVSLVTVLCVALLVYVGLHQSQPPSVVGAGAPAAEFSAARAMKHLAVIADHPHPIGSSEHARVRDYIVSELRALGLSPEIQQTSVVNTSMGAPFAAGHVENVVARLKGAESGRATMLVSHYDSATNSFGASDNGTAVAALLETARALKSSPPLKNDLIFLFTDGEEAGLLGAKAFVDEHPWAKDVRLVFNFDARGNSGSAIMFETSNQNGALIRGFARSAPYPVTTSLSYEIYKRLPNFTDFTEFKRAGLAGLNFAYLNGVTHYHSRLDNIAATDERSLQHQGSYALALAHQFGDDKEDIKKEGNAVYFNIFRTTFYYSQRWVLPLVAIVTVLFGAVAALGFRKKQLTLKGTLLGFVVFFAAVIAASLLTTLVWWALQTSRDRLGVPPLGDAYHQYFYAAGFIALAVAVFSVVYLLFRGKASAPNLWLGALAWWLLLMIATGVWLPGGSYLLAWPLMFSLIALGVVFLDASRTISTKSFIVLLLCAVPGFLLLAPIIYFVYIALGMTGLLALILLVTLLLGLLLPLQSLVTVSNRWAVPAVAASIFVGCIVAGSAVSGFDEGHPRQNSIFYAENADTREAVWATLDPKPDAYTSQFFSSGARRGSINDYVPVRFNLLYTPAPLAALPAPNVELLSDGKDSSDARNLKLRITSPRGAPSVRVYLDSGVEVLKAVVAGKVVDHEGASQKRWGINYQALPPEGIELSLQVRSHEPVKIRVMDQSYELPQLSAAQKGRPVDTMPASLLPYSDSTLISKTFIF